MDGLLESGGCETLGREPRESVVKFARRSRSARMPTSGIVCANDLQKGAAGPARKTAPGEE
jgi:hypothetical protein